MIIIISSMVYCYNTILDNKQQILFSHQTNLDQLVVSTVQPSEKMLVTGNHRPIVMAGYLRLIMIDG